LLYGLSIGVAYMVYPKKDQPKEEQA